MVAGATMYSSALCYAHTASDAATDPVYNNGWDEGDNGGSGFGPWSFDGTYNTADPGQQAMDDGLQSATQTSSQHNNIGEAWTLFNPLGAEPDGANPNPPTGTDIARVGRALPNGGLHIGDTLSITVDNPTERNFFRGWTIKLLQGGANACYAGDNCTTPAFDPGSIQTKLGIGTFEYFTNGAWFDGDGGAGLSDTDTNDGVVISITRTGRQTAQVTMTSPGNAVVTDSVPLSGRGLGDWLMVEYYGTDSDSYPALVVPPRGETDFYISEMSVDGVPEPGTASLIVLGGGALAALAGARRRKE